MIVAAGLTPAWQQIVRLAHFRMGEVNRAQDVHWCASGKVLNVALALAHLGAPCECVSLLGGAPGEAIAREFNALGIAHRWTETHWSTRVCTTILDSQSGVATELVENAGPVTAAELDHFSASYAAAAAIAKLVVLNGSLPRGSPPTFFHDLLAVTPCRAILDCRGPELIEALGARPFLVKPNREELAATLGRSLSTDAQLRAAMQELHDRGAQWVVVSDAARPAWVSTPDACYRITPPSASLVNPIGSGDCLAAGIAVGLLAEKSPLEAIRFGIAAAVDNVGQLLPGRIDPVRVAELADGVLAENIALE